MTVIERLLRQRQPLVCLDFGRDRLSALEVADRAVIRWTARPLADDVLRNGSPSDPSTLGAIVRDTLLAAGIQAQRAWLALPDEATVSRNLVLPRMSRRDLVRAMHYAAEKHVPFPIDRARWSWDVIERSSEQISVYLVATWRDVVEQYAEVARFAGLEPEVLEPRAIAVARALDQERAVVVDAGPRRVHVTLLVHGQPVFIDQTSAGTAPAELRDAVDRLLQRAYRHQSTVTEPGSRMAPVLLAGDLELVQVQLPVGGRSVGEVLNGNLPAIPPDFQAGAYLANLGLSLRVSRWV